MCKILVISDVHGRLRDLRWVLQNETADAMFYLGDGLYDLNAALELRREPVPYPIYRVAGNCDVNYSEPSEGLAPFGAVRPHPPARAGARRRHGGHGVQPRQSARRRQLRRHYD